MPSTRTRPRGESSRKVLRRSLPSPTEAPSPSRKRGRASWSRWAEAVRKSLGRSWIRIAVLAGSLLLLLPILFFVGIVLGVNPIVGWGVETLGSEALKVPVQLDRARISFGGRAHLRGFSVGNPSGFQASRAFAFDSLYAEASMRSVFREVVDLPELVIEKPEFWIELGRKGEPSNWTVLMRNLAESLPKRYEGKRADQDKKFVIHRLRIVAPVVHFRSPLLPNGFTVPLKDIELKEIGTAPGTASKTYVVLATILQAILTGGLGEGKDLPGDIRGPLDAELSEAARTFGEVLKSGK
jgi:hypothetical protein